MCDKVVCERWCVTKLCVKDGVCKRVCFVSLNGPAKIFLHSALFSRFISWTERKTFYAERDAFVLRFMSMCLRITGVFWSDMKKNCV